MNANSIDSVIASLRNARIEVKATAAAARATAPKGTKMVAGQHAQAVASGAVAQSAIPAILGAGWVASSVTVNKAGTDISVHFRAPVTLEQRLAKWQDADAKRKAIREAARAAKAAATAPVVALPQNNAQTQAAANLLAQIDAALASRKAA